MAGCGCNTCSGLPIGPRGLKGDTGAAGAAGAAGANGQYGGFSSRWLFSDTTSSNPSSTTLRLNNSSPASATLIYVNETNADSTNVQPFLNSFSNGGNFGLIRIFKEFNSAIFADYQVGLVMDSGSYFTIGVTYVSGSGSFSANDSVVLSFAANGDNGQDGVAVIDSLNYDYMGKMNDSDALFPSAYIDIPPNWLDSNGDMLEFEMVVASNSDGSVSNGIIAASVVISNAHSAGSGAICGTAITFTGNANENSVRLHIRGKITRISDVLYRADAQSFAGSTGPSYGGQNVSATGAAVSTLFNNDIDSSCPSIAGGITVFPQASFYAIPSGSANADTMSLIHFSVWAAKKI